MKKTPVSFLLISSAHNTHYLMPDKTGWKAGREITKLETDGKYLHATGGFRYIGQNSGGAASLSATTGRMDKQFSENSGGASARVSAGMGVFFTGNKFAGVNTAGTDNLIYFKPDGSLLKTQPEIWIRIRVF